MIAFEAMTRKMEELGSEKYGHAKLLRQVKGVEPITARFGAERHQALIVQTNTSRDRQHIRVFVVTQVGGVPVPFALCRDSNPMGKPENNPQRRCQAGRRVRIVYVPGLSSSNFEFFRLNSHVSVYR